MTGFSICGFSNSKMASPFPPVVPNHEGNTKEEKNGYVVFK
jgi:hypothetical protein